MKTLLAILENPIAGILFIALLGSALAGLVFALSGGLN